LNHLLSEPLNVSSTPSQFHAVPVPERADVHDQLAQYAAFLESANMSHPDVPGNEKPGRPYGQTGMNRIHDHESTASAKTSKRPS
jgi:hypothetical protein